MWETSVHTTHTEYIRGGFRPCSQGADKKKKQVCISTRDNHTLRYLYFTDKQSIGQLFRAAAIAISQ